MNGYSNQPIPKEAAKQLLALDLQDKEILSYYGYNGAGKSVKNESMVENRL